MSTHFYPAGAVANVVLIRWSDYVGRNRVMLGIARSVSQERQFTGGTPPPVTAQGIAKSVTVRDQ